MSNLIDRYVHEVGRSLPRKDRADIEAELRSLIYDRLDDRFGGSPTDADIAAVLKELGDPRKMSASYRREQYLIGPAIYPYMVATLRYVLVTVPAIVAFLHIFGALTSSQPVDVPTFLRDSVLNIAYVTFLFVAQVVLIFAAGEWLFRSSAPKDETFDPNTLPNVDDPRTVDRSEAIGGVVMGIVGMLLLSYFFAVGGLTLHFNGSMPSDLVPVARGWLGALIAAVMAMTVIQLIVLRAQRWTAALWLTETVLELFGAVCLYFVLYQPLFQRLGEVVPSLGESGLVSGIPQLIVILTIIGTVATRANRLLRLWQDRKGDASPFTVTAST